MIDKMKQRAWNALLLASTGVCASAAFASTSTSTSTAEPHRRGQKAKSRQLSQSRLVATSASLKATNTIPEILPKSSRTYQTAADDYFKKHGRLPLPRIVHAVLPEPTETETTKEEPTENETKQRKNILVIGDVHGCLEELLLLHHKAVKENDDEDFHWIVLVGDLCNKGPQSARVVQHVRTQDRWLAVRGNHDNGALAAALGDKERREKKTYQWVDDGTDDDDLQNQQQSDIPVEKATLSDEDVLFLADLPYTFRIPGSALGDSVDTVVVHAGLIPNLPLEDQTIETMITIRELQKSVLSDEYIYHRWRTKEEEQEFETVFGEPEAWAEAWQSNQSFRVIFGHDARRGYQRYEGDWAIGLDTGACYGKKLTSIILPSRKIVSVDAVKTHCPIAK